MAYEVTATRRRPQQFSDLVGQDFVASTLKNSIESKQIAHAYLFTGPRGCGKTSTARILAKSLNCANGPTSTPCGKCPQCLEITKGASLDVIEIDGASNTSINDIRQIKDEILFPPIKSRYKIYIIDEVHMLSNGAFNALLKTIEEPPPYVVFIFATTELHKVPATIKSRCQQFNFKLVPIEQVKNLLQDATNELNAKAQEEALYWIAKEGAGSIRDSYTLFDQVLSFSNKDITFQKIKDKLGLLGTEKLNTLFEFCATNKPKEAIEFLDVILESGISVEQITTNCTDYLRNLLLIKVGVTKESLLGQSHTRFCQTALQNWDTARLEIALSSFLTLFRDIRYCVSPRYELELCITKLCFLCDYVTASQVKTAIEQAATLLLGTPQNAPAKTIAYTPPPAPAQTTQTLQNSTTVQPTTMHFDPKYTSNLAQTQPPPQVQTQPQVQKPFLDNDNSVKSTSTNIAPIKQEATQTQPKDMPEPIKQALEVFDGKVVGVIPAVLPEVFQPQKENSPQLTATKTITGESQEENQDTDEIQEYEGEEDTLDLD